MNIISKKSFRSPGKGVNKTDDMVRITVDMSLPEAKRFESWVNSLGSGQKNERVIELAKEYAEKRSGEVAYHTMYAFIEWVVNLSD